MHVNQQESFCPAVSVLKQLKSTHQLISLTVAPLHHHGNDCRFNFTYRCLSSLRWLFAFIIKALFKVDHNCLIESNHSKHLNAAVETLKSSTEVKVEAG